MGPEERAVRDVHSTWFDAVNAGYLARLLTLIADDVVFLNPGHAPLRRGREMRDAPNQPSHPSAAVIRFFTVQSFTRRRGS
jgi:hypothetical protein